MDDTSRSLQARVAAILFFLHVQSRKILEIPQSCKVLLSTIPLQRRLVYTGRMSSTFTIRDIVNEDATASVSDYGAHVLSWAPAGEQAVVWRPKAIHLREGTAIRGGVPIIFPWFNSGFEGGHVASKKPKHGFAAIASGIMTRKVLPMPCCAIHWIPARSTQIYFPSLFLDRILNFMPFTPLKSAVS